MLSLTVYFVETYTCNKNAPIIAIPQANESSRSIRVLTMIRLSDLCKNETTIRG